MRPEWSIFDVFILQSSVTIKSKNTCFPVYLFTYHIFTSLQTSMPKLENSFLNNNLTHFLMPTNDNADENTKLPKW